MLLVTCDYRLADKMIFLPFGPENFFPIWPGHMKQGQPKVAQTNW